MNAEELGSGFHFWTILLKMSSEPGFPGTVYAIWRRGNVVWNHLTPLCEESPRDDSDLGHIPDLAVCEPGNVILWGEENGYEAREGKARRNFYR